jgi:Fe2+ transport system protein FeoA
VNTIDRVRVGATVRLVEPDPSLEASLREHLAAFGLLPGHPVTVVAQRPMTIVLCDHVELALEAAVAAKLRVTTPAAQSRPPRA